MGGDLAILLCGSWLAAEVGEGIWDRMKQQKDIAWFETLRMSDVSNDLTQLMLDIDRDSGLVAGAFDERNDAVKALLGLAIRACRKASKYIGICGQGPSGHPDLAQWLVEQGIEAVSLNPDTAVGTWLHLAGRNGTVSRG